MVLGGRGETGESIFWPQSQQSQRGSLAEALVSALSSSGKLCFNFKLKPSGAISDLGSEETPLGAPSHLAG